MTFNKTRVEILFISLSETSVRLNHMVEFLKEGVKRGLIPVESLLRGKKGWK